MKILILSILVFLFSAVKAQEFLSVDDAVNLALKNNYDILVARNDADIDVRNNTAGNAGMLPEVRATGSGNYEINTLDQNLKEGENKYSNHPTSSVNLGAELSWTLFDGGRMFVAKARLDEIATLGEVRFRDEVLQTLYAVISAYYDVVKEKQTLISINEAMNFNRERVKIAQTGFNAGSLLKTDLLQAKIDLNVNMENAINQQYVIEASRKALNQLLGRDPDKQFEVSDSIPTGFTPDRDEIMAQVNENNTAIQTYRKQLNIAELNVKEYQKVYLPLLNVRAGYYLSKSNSPYGSVLNALSYGPGIGGTISIPLYTAGEYKRQVAVAKIRLNSAEYDLQNVTLRVNTVLLNAFTNFENQARLLEIETENRDLTRENLEISLQRLRLGQTTSLEVHQAQDDFVKSATRLINFQYNLMVAETKLKQLMAVLGE